MGLVKEEDIVLDELNIFILKTILDSYKTKAKVTTWDIAKRFVWSDKKTFDSISAEDEFYTNKTNVIKNRLDRLAMAGVIKKEKKKNAKGTTFNDYAIEPKKYNGKELQNDVNLLIRDNFGRWWIILEM